MYIYIPDLRYIFSVGHYVYKRPEKNELFDYFISLSEVKEIINLDNNFKTNYNYNFSDWYQVWQDLKESYPNTEIRIQYIEFI